MSAAIKRGTRKLTDRQRELIASVAVGPDNVARYTGGRIPDWKALKTVMEALGGTWKRGPQGFEFGSDVDAEELVATAQATGEITDPKLLGFFETGSILADELVGLLDLQPGHRVLEPSAGRGALVQAVRRCCGDAEIVAVELLPENCDALERNGLAHKRGDFLEFVRADLGGQFDRVIMNPPFARQADIAHVLHAMQFLKPGGVLVSVMGAGVTFRQDRIATDFRAYVARLGGTITDLPEASFAASGTMVRTVVVRLVAPGVTGTDDEEAEPEPDTTPEPARTTGRRDYAERRAARIERLQARAERARAEGTARVETARQRAAVIPFGQPILVGHHSEGRDRRYRARIEQGFTKGFAELKKADQLDRRAAAAEANEAISSDDPEAIQKLKQKLEDMDRYSERWKTINKALRSKDREAAVAALNLTDRERSTIKFAPAGRGFILSNASAEKRRIKARIAELEARAARSEREPEIYGDIEIREEDNRVQIVFPDKPSEDVRKLLKSNGFKWAPSTGAWQRQASERSWWIARDLVKSLLPKEGE
jgi:predicted RNA methylase